MRRINKYIFFISSWLVGLNGVAQPSCPTYPNCPGVTPPPGLPLNDKLVLFFISALLFGFYKIYISILKKKSSN